MIIKITSLLLQLSRYFNIKVITSHKTHYDKTILISNLSHTIDTRTLNVVIFCFHLNIGLTLQNIFLCLILNSIRTTSSTPCGQSTSVVPPEGNRPQFENHCPQTLAHSTNRHDRVASRNSWRENPLTCRYDRIFGNLSILYFCKWD